MPAAAMSVDAQYDAALNSLPDGDAKDAGVATGRAAAAAILARRSSDDLLAAITKPYTPGPADPGVYQPTAPLNFVLLAGWGELAPFALDSASQFRSPAPASLESSRYTFDFAEAKAVGSASSTRRTRRQTETALFWYDAATKEWNAAARQVLADRSTDEWRAARALAVLNIALADAVIATFEAKFHFNYWRPISAIHGGDHDGNPATRGDADWQPLCVTPPFPEYPSTHAATGAAAATSLALELGDRHEFIVSSPTGASRTYRRFSAAAYDEGVSRIYCGIHFRTAMNMGFLWGRELRTTSTRTCSKPSIAHTEETDHPVRHGTSASCASPERARRLTVPGSATGSAAVLTRTGRRDSALADFSRIRTPPTEVPRHDHIPAAPPPHRPARRRHGRRRAHGAARTRARPRARRRDLRDQQHPRDHRPRRSRAAFPAARLRRQGRAHHPPRRRRSGRGRSCSTASSSPRTSERPRSSVRASSTSSTSATASSTPSPRRSARASASNPS